MNYIKDADKLAAVAKVLSEYTEDIKRYYRSQFDLQVKGEYGKKGLETIFYTQTKARRGASTKNSEDALKEFQGGIEDIISKCYDKKPNEAHSDFLEWLCGIKHINQKIANLFLKMVVMFEKEYHLNLLDFSSWKVYLHVPLDRWVTRLLGEGYLDIGTKEYNEHFNRGSIPAFDSRKYRQLQEQLEEVLANNPPRIILDNLWFVGHNFCGYDKYLCDQCWISNWCKKQK